MENPSPTTSPADALVLSATPPVLTTIEIGPVTADAIGVNYTTIPGNMPQTYGNMLLLWQNSAGSIPWVTPPLSTFPIPGNTPSGSTVFPGLSVTDNTYVVGYAVGPLLTGTGMQAYGNVCTSAYIPNVTGPYTNSSPSLSVLPFGPSSVAVNYELPSGVQPLSNGAWIGIWNSGSPSYATPPLAAVPVPDNTQAGTVGINNFPIRIGQPFTVALFTSGYNSKGGSIQTAMAAYVTFNS